MDRLFFSLIARGKGGLGKGMQGKGQREGDWEKVEKWENKFTDYKKQHKYLDTCVSKLYHSYVFSLAFL